jgi:adenosylhomocysteinase
MSIFDAVVYRARAQSFFSDVTAAFSIADDLKPTTIVVTHALPDVIDFLSALSRLSTVGKVLVKPNSINQNAFQQIARSYDTAIANRNALYDPSYATQLVGGLAAATSAPVAALDVGGYFSQPLAHLKRALGDKFAGVVEDTENGQQKYERLPKLDACVYSVARSPLKYAEDNLVGHSVVFAMEAVIRSFADIINGKEACVIGYGKIGKSAALNMRDKGLSVSVHDIDPVKLVQARADGFRVHSELEPALANSDIIVSSTGNLSIKTEFDAIKPGAYLASVTSSDDELDLGQAQASFTVTPVGDNIERYENAKTHFYVLNKGNAVNFLSGPSAGRYIALVQAEIIACLEALSKKPGHGLREADAPARRIIAQKWLQTFGKS